MRTVTLQVDCGQTNTLAVEMPAATTGKYAFKRCLEALGHHPDGHDGFIAPVVDGFVDPERRLSDDEIAADWDGRVVVVVLTG